jgi:hypothetical protein
MWAVVTPKLGRQQEIVDGLRHGRRVIFVPQKTAVDSSMGSPRAAVQHGVSLVGGSSVGGLGGLVVLVVVVLIGGIPLGCGPPF